MSKKRIEELIENQPKGYVKMISERLNISRMGVYKAVNKGELDHPVILEMIKLAEEHKNTLKQIEARIDKIAS